MKKIISIVCMFTVLLFMAEPAQAAAKDTKAPTVTKTSPANLDTDVMIESSIVIRFSENIVKGKSISKVTLKDGNKKAVTYTYEIKDNLLIISPKSDLKYNTQYAVGIPADAVKDKAGNSLKQPVTSGFLTELDPSKESTAAAPGKKYLIEIEANLDSEPTPETQQYLEQYMKLFGVDAKIISVEPIK